MRVDTIAPGKPLDEAQTAKYLEHFHRDGFAIVPGVLSSDEVN